MRKLAAPKLADGMKIDIVQRETLRDGDFDGFSD